MINPLFGSNYKYDPASGEFIHAKHRQLHGAIQRYWPDLRLVWIPRNQRVTEEERAKPYALVDRFDRVVMWFTDADMDRPDKVLARIYEGDLSKHPKGYVLSMLEAEELARVLLDEQKAEEEREERRELAASILRSPFNKYTVRHKNGEKLTFRS